MRYHWEELDIVPGRRVSSWNRAENYIVTYDPAVVKGTRYGMTSLADGQQTVAATRSKGDLAKHLNAHGYRPVSVLIDDMSKDNAPPA